MCCFVARFFGFVLTLMRNPTIDRNAANKRQVALAMIPHTVSARQLGMAFAVVEVLGNTMNMTDIIFGWLRDRSGNYDDAMKLLLVYALLGITLWGFARKQIEAIGIGSLKKR